MSKRLKDGVYKTTVGGSPMRYFVHDGLVVMSSKYGTFKTTENFMLGMQYSVNPEPLPDHRNPQQLTIMTRPRQ